MNSILLSFFILGIFACKPANKKDANSTTEAYNWLPKFEECTDIPIEGEVHHSSGSLSGESLLTYINKDEQNHLNANWQPQDLQDIDKSHIVSQKQGSKWVVQLRADANRHLNRMLNEAKKENLKIKVYSSYRPYVYQCYTFNTKAVKDGVATAKSKSAVAGASQHQLGTAIDLVVGNGQLEGFKNTKEHKWLEANAHKYGFMLSYPEEEVEITGYIYEPWHWRYIGVEATEEAVANSLIMDEYLKACNKRSKIQESYLYWVTQNPDQCSVDPICASNFIQEDYKDLKQFINTCLKDGDLSQYITEICAKSKFVSSVNSLKCPDKK